MYACERKFTWKYELQADSTTLCACKCLPSAARVTSTKDWLLRRLENTDIKFGWWLFHLKQYCWTVIANSFVRRSCKKTLMTAVIVIRQVHCLQSKSILYIGMTEFYSVVYLQLFRLVNVLWSINYVPILKIRFLITFEMSNSVVTCISYA